MKRERIQRVLGKNPGTRLFAYICSFKEMHYLMRVFEYYAFLGVLKKKGCFTSAANRRPNWMSQEKRDKLVTNKEKNDKKTRIFMSSNKEEAV